MTTCERCGKSFEQNPKGRGNARFCGAAGDTWSCKQKHHRDKVLAYNELHRERLKAYYKEYYRKNRERILAAQRERSLL